MKKQQLLVMLAMSAYSLNIDAQQWDPVGPATITPDAVTSVSMKLKNNLPYVAIGDGYAGTETNLLAYDGTNWDTVGTATLTTGDERDQFLAFDANGVPHIAYTAADDSYRVKVIKYDAGTSTWGNLGVSPLGSQPDASSPFLAFRSNNAYVAYNYTVSNPMPVENVRANFFNNTVWSSNIINSGNSLRPNLGFIGSRMYYTIQVDIQGNGFPGDIALNYYSTTNTNTIGVDSKNDADSPKMIVDGTDIYIAFRDYSGSNGGSGTVLKYDGSSLTTVGTTGFAAVNGPNSSFSLAAYNNQPYLAFRDGFNSNRITVMRFDGTSWVTVGTAGFSTGSVTDVNLEISSTGTAYVAYKDVTTAGQLAVKKYDLTVSIDEIEAINKAINLYPNPATNVVTVETELNVNQINILSIDGKAVKSATTKTISVEDLPQGVYTLEILTSEGKGFKKFVKK